MQQPPVFRGFYGPGQVWQPWGNPEAFGPQAPAAAGQGLEQPETTPSEVRPSASSAPSVTSHEQRHQPAGEPLAPTPTPTTASSSTPDSARTEPTTSESSMDPRRAAAQAALRRLNPSTSTPIPTSVASPNSQPTPVAPPANAAPTPSSSVEVSTPAAPAPVNPALRPEHTASGPSASELGSGEQPSTSAERASQPTLPTLIPLYDPSMMQPTRVPGSDTFYAPFDYPYRGQSAWPSAHASTHQPATPRQSSQHQIPRAARTGPGRSRTPLTQLPPSLTDEQLARLDRLTREAIDERLRVLEGVSGAIYRCMEELTRVRSVLPSASARRAAQQQARDAAVASSVASAAGSTSTAGGSATVSAASSSGAAVDAASEAAGVTLSEDEWVSPDAAESPRADRTDGVTSESDGGM